jgi:hypothetical protein
VLKSPAGARNTPDRAVCRPDSAALSRPNLKVLGGMPQSVRLGAWLYPRYEHPAHPLPFVRPRRVVPKFIEEPRP